MRSLLGRITASESPETIDKSGQLMASKIRTVQKNRKKMVTEELKAVIAERDAAVEKVIKRRYFSFCKQQQKLTLNIWQGSLKVIPSILLYSFLVMIFFMFTVFHIVLVHAIHV